MIQKATLLCACALFAATAASPQNATSPSSCSPLNNQSLRCPQFGFTYQVPYGWVDRTADMQFNDSKSAAGATRRQSKTLLAVFERPPEARGESINSGVIIAAESRSDYPQVKIAADYFGPISDLAAQNGMKPLSDPYSFSAGSKQLVREDFSGSRGQLPVSQSSLVLLTKSQILSFTFIAGSEDEIEDLIANLHFSASSRKQSPTH